MYSSGDFDGRICEGSYIEHSILAGDYLIKRRSIVSHVRQYFGLNIKLRDEIMVQEIPVIKSDVCGVQECASKGLVLIVIGLNDDVKVAVEES
jgi:hypothetical protein